MGCNGSGSTSWCSCHIFIQSLRQMARFVSWRDSTAFCKTVDLLCWLDRPCRGTLGETPGRALLQAAGSSTCFLHCSFGCDARHNRSVGPPARRSNCSFNFHAGRKSFYAALRCECPQSIALKQRIDAPEANNLFLIWHYWFFFRRGC